MKNNVNTDSSFSIDRIKVRKNEEIYTFLKMTDWKRKQEILLEQKWDATFFFEILLEGIDSMQNFYSSLSTQTLVSL